MRNVVHLLVLLVISLPLSGCIAMHCYSGYNNHFVELANGTSGELDLAEIEDIRINNFNGVTGVLFAVEQSDFDVDDDFIIVFDGVEYEKQKLLDTGIPEESYHIWKEESASECSSTPDYPTQFGNVSIDGIDYWGIHVKDTLYYLDRENPEFESNMNVTVFVHGHGLTMQT